MRDEDFSHGTNSLFLTIPSAKLNLHVTLYWAIYHCKASKISSESSSNYLCALVSLTNLLNLEKEKLFFLLPTSPIFDSLINKASSGIL